jgi:tetratricopeptide (TPR) repeat protein
VAHTINRKELRQPDEFVSFWTRLGTKVSSHRRLVIVSGVVLVGGTLGGWGLMTWQEARSVQDTEAFARIESTALAPIVPEKADKAEPAKPAKTSDGEGPRFKTHGERLQATVTEADAFLAAHGSSRLARRAQLVRADALLEQGKGAEAAVAFQQIIDGEQDKALRLVEQDGLALAFEAQGQIDKAIEVYGRMADEARQVNNFYADRALYGKARLLERQGKGKDAEKILREILDKTPKTSLRREIDDRLAALADK